MAIRALIFDLFDTLVDLLGERLPIEEYNGRRLPASVRALYESLPAGVDVSFDRFTEAMIEGEQRFVESHYEQDQEVTTLERFEDLAERLGIEDAALPQALTDVHMGILRSAVEIPGHHEALIRSLGEGLRIGVCSNFSHSETAVSILEESGMHAHLDAVVVSDAFGLRKPRREIFEEVMGLLDASPDQVLHVGDSLRADVGGAAQLGIRTVWITRRIRDPQERLRVHEGPAPTYVIEDLAELPALVAGLG